VPTRVDGDALHRGRSARGLTQSQLAQIIDVSALEFCARPNGVDLKALKLASGKTWTEIAEQTQVSSATYATVRFHRASRLCRHVRAFASRIGRSPGALCGRRKGRNGPLTDMPRSRRKDAAPDALSATFADVYRAKAGAARSILRAG